MKWLLSALLLGSTLASAAAPLRYHWKAGQTIRFHERSSEDRSVSSKLSGVSQHVRVELRSGHTWRVLSVDAKGSAKIQISYDYVAQRIENGDSVVIGDSRAPHDPYSALTAAIVGKSYTVTIDDRGNIQAVTGVDELMDAVRDQMVKLGVPPEARPELDAQLSAIVGEDGAKTSLQTLVVPFPERPISRGETWKHSWTIDAQSAVETVALEYRLDSDPARGPLKISATGTLSSKPSVENVELEYDRDVVTLSWAFEPKTHLPTTLEDTLDSAAKVLLPDGDKKVVGAEEQTRRTLKVTSGEPPVEPAWTPSAAKPAEPTSPTVTAIAFSNDGKRFVVGGVAGALLSAPKREDPPIPLRATDVIAVAFANGGARVLTASANGRVSIWDAADGKEQRSFDLGTRPARVAFSPEGTRLAVAASDFEIALWDVETGKPLRTLAKPTEAATFLSVSGEGRRVVASAPSGFAILEGATGKLLLAAKPPLSGSASAVSADGHYAVISGEESLELWDLEAGRPLAALRGNEAPVRLLSIDAEGARVAAIVGDQRVLLWDRAGHLGLSGELPGAAVATFTLRGDGHEIVWSDVHGDINMQTYEPAPP